MDKWQYKYSFLSGILLILSYISKMITINTGGTLMLILIPYLLMVIYIAGLFLGFIKYSILNEKSHLFWSTTTLVLFSILRIITELLYIINVFSDESLFLSVTNFSLAIAFIQWGVIIFIQKKMYGKSTLLSALLSCLLSFSMFIPLTGRVILIQPVVYLIFYISVTYLIKKNADKLKSKKSKSKPRMLRNDLL